MDIRFHRKYDQVKVLWKTFQTILPEQNDAQNEQSNHHSDHKETLDTHAMQNCPDDEPKNDTKENGKEKVINDNFLREHSLEQH